MSENEPLPRVLGMADMVLLGISSVIGSGIFLLPGIAAGAMGPAAILPLLCAGALCFLIALCYAEVGSRFSATGGAYLYAGEAFGPFVGFSVGWMSWWVRIISWAALANGFALALRPMLGAAPGLLHEVVVTAVIVGLTAVNFRSAKSGAAVMKAFAIAKLIPLVIFIGVGLFFLDAQLFIPFAPDGYGPLGDTTIVLLWAFVGFEAVAVPAGEMRDPGRTVPLTFLIVMGTTTLVYLLVFTVACGTYAGLPGSENPVAEAASGFLGSAGGTLVGIGILVSIFGTSSVSALVAPRSIFALAERGQAPAIFARVHSEYGTPTVGLLVSAAATLAIALSGSFEELAVISVVARFSQYLPTCLAVPVLRRRDQRSERSPARFRLPLGPIIPILATALCIALLVQTEPARLLAGGAAFALGIPIYFMFGRRAQGR